MLRSRSIIATVTTVITTVALAACGSGSGTPRQTAAAAVPVPPVSTHVRSTASGGSVAAAGKLDPASFSAQVDNPWFPLKPGTVYRYRGSKDGKPAFEVLRVTDRVKRILGVPNVVIDDRLYLDGKLAEVTTDWYTQDRRGAVWYFGEKTATLSPTGKLQSREGSFQAGVDGARPGM